MAPIQVAIISVGSLKYPFDFRKLTTWQSKIVQISHGPSIEHLPNAQGPDWTYPDAQLSALIRAVPNSNITLALVNVPLQDNYYLRRLNSNVAVLSFFEMAEIARAFHFTIECYVLRNIHEIAVLFAANGGLIPANAITWAHDDVRGCLFDMNASKLDIIFSMHKPTLCPECSNRLHSKQIDPSFLPNLRTELGRIRKTLYFRAAEWVQVHPLWALAVTAAFGVILNFAASVLFEKAKHVLPWLS